MTDKNCCSADRKTCKCNCEYCPCGSKGCVCQCSDCSCPKKVLEFPLGYQLIVEALGSAALVFVFIASCTYLPFFSQYGGQLQVGILGGLTLLAMIVAFGRISKGYFNPAVTLGAAIAGRLNPVEAVSYIIAQIAGAALAVIPYFYMLPEITGYLDTRKWFELASNGYHTHSPYELLQTLFGSGVPVDFRLRAVLTMEVLATAILTVVFLKTVNLRVAQRGIAIGGTFAFLMTIAIPVSSGGLNPARSIMTALLAQDWGANPFEGPITQLWVYIIGPCIGAILAGLFVFITDVVKKIPTTKSGSVDKSDNDTTSTTTQQKDDSVKKTFVKTCSHHLPIDKCVLCTPKPVSETKTPETKTPKTDSSKSTQN